MTIKADEKSVYGKKVHHYLYFGSHDYKPDLITI